MTTKAKKEKTITIKVDAKTFEKIQAATKKAAPKKKTAKKAPAKSGIDKFNPPKWA
jgi:hypothetical protein